VSEFCAERIDSAAQNSDTQRVWALFGRPCEAGVVRGEERVAAVYARATAAVPELATLIAPGTPALPGTVLSDAGWLADRLSDAARLWAVENRRVIGTLWWYAASSTLLAPPVIASLVAGRALDLEPAALTVWVRPDGYLGGGRTDRLLDDGSTHLGAAVRAHLGAIIRPLATVSGATEPALWAIATDSLSTWALRAGTAVGSVARGTGLAVAVARQAGAMPAPRFVEVPGRDGTPRWYVRRCSCCLIYHLPGAELCISCPRQPPTERLRRLIAHARSD